MSEHPSKRKRIIHMSSVHRDRDVRHADRRVVDGADDRRRAARPGAVRDRRGGRRSVHDRVAAALARGEGQRLGGGDDVHAGEELVDHLDFRAGARLVAEPIREEGTRTM